MNILQRIIGVKAKEVMAKKRRIPFSELEKRKMPKIRDFRSALTKPGLSVIAEIKRKSPSGGLIREDFDPEAIANIYYHHGASAISVLTDFEFFGGRDDYPMLVKQTVELPVLRKEFIIDPYQILESRVLGADAILLLANVLDTSRLTDSIHYATELNMDCLVEVHNEQEMECTLKAGASIVGVNNRDLRTFEVSIGTSLELKALIPDEVVTVSESGIHTYEDMKQLEFAGFDAVLVGTSLMRAQDIGEALRGLRGM
jgi:indole-3-glycerol phosphate synthase